MKSPSRRDRRAVRTVASVLALCTATPVASETLRWGPTMNFNGAPGIVDMPSGEAMPDGEFTVGVSSFAGISRATLSFQLAPWLGASFRYAQYQDLNWGGYEDYYDRSFDIRLTPVQEEGFWPSITIGLMDFAGTGLLSSEYIAATKTITPELKVTAGLGWGRLGTGHDLGSPFGDRPPPEVGEGGDLNADTWFKGPMSPFAGIEWRPTDALGFKIEYSSDTYGLETRQGMFDHKSNWNLGAEYQLSDNFRLGAYYAYGSELGVTLQIALNPKNPPNRNTMEKAPLPVVARPDPQQRPDAWTTEWVTNPEATQTLAGRLDKVLVEEGMQVEALSVTATTARLRLRNETYDQGPQAIGRAARAMTRTLPASIETFEIEPVTAGVPAARVTLRRSDVEALENAPDASNQMLARTTFGEATDAVVPGTVFGEGLYPRFRWSLGPNIRLSWFDPDQPVRGDLDLTFALDYDISPGLVFSAAFSKNLFGNLDSVQRASDSELPHVRSDSWLYDLEGDPSIDRLQLAWYRHPFEEVYTRVSLGYLERMFGGISTEVLWAPVTSSLALGAEVNWVKQRDFDMALGFQDYDVTTGHVSAYYNLGDGYLAQLDVGRYLAGDWGATISLDREFANGWSVGAYATFTDVSAEQFGEGSYDKGIRFTIPISWLLGQPTQQTYRTTIQPLTRDGGARLDVTGRLYETVRRQHQDRLEQQWGKVWR